MKREPPLPLLPAAHATVARLLLFLLPGVPEPSLQAQSEAKVSSFIFIYS